MVSVDMMKLLLPIRGGAGNDFTMKPGEDRHPL